MKKILLTVGLVILFFSCDDKFQELNTPKKNATKVPFPTLFTSATRSLSDMMVSCDVNENNFRLYAQYWAQTTYPDESRYDMVGRQVPDNIWQNAYRDVLKDLFESRKALATTPSVEISDEDRTMQEGIINVVEVYTWSVIADLWGAAPFTEALDESNLNPKYDASADIYAHLIDSLDVAITKLESGGAGFAEEQDRIYEGDTEKWYKFANSLKIRIAINLSDVDAAKATTMINEALAKGVFESNEDNASFSYLSQQPNTNPVWNDLVNSGRHDFVASNTLVDKMIALTDPRISVYADTITGGTYLGGTYGDANAYRLHSHVSARITDPAREGVLLDYAEVNFLLAEAVAKGLAITGLTAEEYYNNGITASFEYWGVPDVASYLANPGVAYATAEGDWKQKIGVQEWLAFYNRGFEGWNTWRRLDFVLFAPPPDMEDSDIPRRLIFPIKEATLNPSSLDAAIEMIGEDVVQTKVFWDVN